MISSFFDKTKPINFLVLLGFVMLLFWAVTFKFYGFHLEYGLLFRSILGSIAVVLSVFLLGNTVKTKKLTLDNSFAMLFFSILLMVFFFALKEANILFALPFLMVSWDRALALKNEKNHKEKIFESALWLFVASLLVEWALVYLIPLYIAISLFCGKQLRLWLMPLAAFFCVFILTLTAALFFDGLHFFEEHYKFPLTLDFFWNPNYGIILFIFFIHAIVFIVFGKLGYRRLGRTLSLRLVFAYLITSIFLLVFAGNQENRIIVFSFFPSAIFLANYVETFKKQKRKELFIMACCILPFLGFVAGLFQ
jgi:hypothetical protein